MDAIEPILYAVDAILLVVGVFGFAYFLTLYSSDEPRQD